MRHLRDMRLPGGRAGTTLAELMVATVIMSVGILGLFGSFKYITRSLFISRAQTLATNLAQERIESLKNLNYYGLLITTAAATESVTGIQYDNGNYGPERISIGGMNFTRYTYVAMADITSNVISTVSVNYPDTGMKQITVNVIWKDNGSTKKWTLSNLLENPNVNPLDATISGTVSISGGGNLSGAQLVVEQNSDWTATANASGSYSFKVYHGSYTVRASSTGFYDSISSPLSVSRNGTTTTNFTLSRVSTGNVAGIAWVNNDLVISQVVVDTLTTADDGNLHDIEYVELFNPTTFPINIGQTADPWPKATSLIYGDNAMPTHNYYYDVPTSWGSVSFGMVNVTTYVAPGHYYLYANAPSFYINGLLVTADAYWDSRTPYKKNLSADKSGGLLLYHWGPGYVADEVGWLDSGGTVGGWYYWPPIPCAAGHTSLGFPAGDQIVRVSSPLATSSDMTAYGNAYNSTNNTNDFLYPGAGITGIVYQPHSSASGTFPIITGRVPSSVKVTASDDNSSALTAYSTTISSGSLNLSYMPFKLTGVTTGTWSVALMSTLWYGAQNWNYSQILSNVTVNQNVTTAIPNAATSPAWPAASKYHVQLTSTTDTGFVRGTVTDANGAAISGIAVSAGGSSKNTGTDGSYFMSVSSGTMNLIANQNNSSNGTYTSSQYSVTVTAGGLTLQDFVLYKGARITGYVTTGTTPVPNQVVNAISGGNQIGTGTSDATGTFTIKNVSTGTYTFSPVLDMGQDASPNSFPNMTISSTGTVFIGTFTISGAYGSIGGTITNASGLVTSGALIIASTQTIASSPPSIAASSAPAQTPYYMISSKADGTYSLPVRGSATYYLSAYVPSMSNSGAVSITTKTYSSIAVTVGGSVTKNITLP